MVGVVAETRVLPESVRGWRLLLPATASAEFGDMLVPHLVARKAPGQDVPVELGVGARSRYRPDVGHEPDLRFAEEFGEFLDRSRRMADREEGSRGNRAHDPDFMSRRVRVNRHAGERDVWRRS